MKNILTLLIIITASSFIQAQFVEGKVKNVESKIPSYEQNAFDFYRTQIIDSFPVKKRIKITKYAFDFQLTIEPDNWPKCLPNVDLKKKFEPISEYSNIKEKGIWPLHFELNFSDLDSRQFKVKKYLNGGFPRLSISLPYKEVENNERVFINIYIKHAIRKTTIYHFEFDDKGAVIDWCQYISEPLIIPH